MGIGKAVFCRLSDAARELGSNLRWYGIFQLEVKSAVAMHVPAPVLVGFQIQTTGRQVEALNLHVGPAQRRPFPGVELDSAIGDDQCSSSLGDQVLQLRRRLPLRGRLR